MVPKTFTMPSILELYRKKLKLIRWKKTKPLSSKKQKKQKKKKKTGRESGYYSKNKLYIMKVGSMEMNM